MMSEPELLSSLISAFVALSGVAAWLIRRRDKRKDPILRTSAELAMAKQALNIIQSSRDVLVDDVERLKTDSTEHRASIVALEAQVNSQTVALDHFRTMLTQASGFIEVMLRWARAGSPPPPPVLPVDLYELIDPVLHLNPTNPQGKETS